MFFCATIKILKHNNIKFFHKIIKIIFTAEKIKFVL